MTTRDAESLEAMHELLKLKTIARVKELYLDLFLAYKNIDLLKDKRELLDRIERLTLARYAAGKAMQLDVIMAQTWKIGEFLVLILPGGAEMTIEMWIFLQLRIAVAGQHFAVGVDVDALALGLLEQ